MSFNRKIGDYGGERYSGDGRKLYRGRVGNLCSHGAADRCHVARLKEFFKDQLDRPKGKLSLTTTLDGAAKQTPFGREQRELDGKPRH